MIYRFWCNTRDYIEALILRRVWSYQRGNHYPYIEEEQTTQWPKEEKGQKDKQRSINVVISSSELLWHAN